MYNSMAFGFALVITARLFGQGLFNNGLNLSFALLNIITPLRAIILLVAQYGGSMTGAALVRLLTGQLAATTRITGISIGRAVVLESLATTTFLFSVLMLVVKKKQGSPIAPIEVGLSLFIHELLTIGYSGGR
jgi:aquaporin related protein